MVCSQMRWSGHVVPMEDSRLAKRLSHGLLKIGEHPRHKPKKRFRDCVKANLKLLEIDVDSWEVLAGNQNEWGRSAKGVTRSK